MLRMLLMWAIVLQGLVPGVVIGSQTMVHDPSRCSCASVGSGCCGEDGACPGAEKISCCGGGEGCVCGCMVRERREPEKQAPRMVVRGEVMVAPTVERRVVMVDVGDVGLGWSVREMGWDVLFAGVRRHMGVCIWQE